MAKPLGVGIIGAGAERGWAKLAHVPAVQQLAGLEIVAVASGSQAKADAAAKAFGAKASYADGKDLIQDPNVHIVTIAVKVPDHRDLVLAALTAGKHVYCEWPLGRNFAETEELAKAAQLCECPRGRRPTNTRQPCASSCTRAGSLWSDRSAAERSSPLHHRRFWSKG
jgi:predicted dehydrogenase